MEIAASERTGLQAEPRRPEADPLVLEVWRIAWPAISHMLLITLVFFVDRLVLGNHSADALASLQISAVLVWTLYAIFGSISAGTLAVAGRALGAGAKAEAGRVAAASMAAAFVVGLAVAAVALAFTSAALPWLFPRAGAAVNEQAAAYLEIVLPVLPLAFVEAAAAASLQAAGDTRTPLVAAAISNLANLVLSVLLVFGLAGLPELGIRGAAVGAATAMALQGVLLAGTLLRRSSPLPVRTALADGGAFDRPTLRRLYDVSLPAFVEKLAYNGGYLVFVMLIGWLGDRAMAANQALISIEAVCFLSADGLGIAAAALVAQKIGAGRPADAARAAGIASRMAIGLLCAVAVLFVAAPRALVSAFNADPEIVAIGATSLYVAALAQPFMAYATVMRMSLCGAGATRTVLLVTLVGTFAVRLPAAWIAAVTLDLGLVGIWIGSTLDWVFQAGVLAWIARRRTWLQRAV